MGNLKLTGTRGTRVIKWIELLCRIPEGQFVGQPVKLRAWQKAEIKKIYDNPAGTRLAIISFGRKNAKSTMAAFLLLAHLCGPEAKYHCQLFSAAQSREQAALIFALAAKIVRMSPDLREVVVIREAKKELFNAELNSVYRALSAEVKTSYGLSPVFIVHDELGQVRGPKSELYDALETATGAQAEPLSVIISTQAPNDADLMSILIDDALARHDPRTVISLYTAPKDDDPFSIATIRKANPALGDFLNKKEVMTMAQKAKRMPSAEAGFRNLVLNQRVETANPFIRESTWMSCGDAVVDDFGDAAVFGGLDLSAVSDLTALVLMGKINDKWHVKPYFWLPSDGIIERSRSDHAPYDVWSREGYLETTPGNSVDWAWVANRIKQIITPLNVQKIAFDRWGFRFFKPQLIDAGLHEDAVTRIFFEFGQGYQSMTPALHALERFILEKKIVHGNHPVLKMCAGNAVVHQGPTAEIRKLDKLRSHGRIDGMVALAMATAMAEGVEQEKPPSYQMFMVA